MSKANHKSIVSSEDAVSPVIGTILMVAVTVILAAVIAAFVFGFTGNMPKAPKVAYVDVQRDTTGVKLTNINPVTQLSSVEIYIDGAATALTADGTLEKCYKGTTAVTDGADGGINSALSTLNGYVWLDGTTYKSPTKITLKASVNGAPSQVIEELSI